MLVEFLFKDTVEILNNNEAVVFRYPEFPEGAKLPLPLDIPVLKKLSASGGFIP